MEVSIFYIAFVILLASAFPLASKRQKLSALLVIVFSATTYLGPYLMEIGIFQDSEEWWLNLLVFINGYVVPLAILVIIILLLASIYRKLTKQPAKNLLLWIWVCILSIILFLGVFNSLTSHSHNFGEQNIEYDPCALREPVTDPRTGRVISYKYTEGCEPW